MASVFTFEPEPPRIQSPWLATIAHSGDGAAEPGASTGLGPRPDVGCQSPVEASPLTRLEQEPQSGPVEYKLHLLLQPRRQYLSSSTGSHVAGSQHSRTGHLHGSDLDSSSVSQVEGPSLPAAPSQQSRQHRLQQLTTQLLWRLQQSSAHHSSSSTQLVVPDLPSPCSLETQQPRDRPVAGLEESHGALYEIGVADDGSFVGLTLDELEESFENLRAMARSLGCTVQILRRAIVGSCEWMEVPSSPSHTRGPLRTAELWVAEAFVRPVLGRQRAPAVNGRSRGPAADHRDETIDRPNTSADDLNNSGLKGPELLRVSLTGATTCGKSSLLGTLSTGTLDNGRGSSRLSMLRHRHEIASGLTSSVTQELIGYRPVYPAGGEIAEVVNYAAGNVSSWTDIHALSQPGRLVFFSDSAGHPRYRRTTVRGLVGWAPDWALVCVAADEAEAALPPRTALTAAIPPSPGIGMDLAEAHLRLSLALELPIVVVLTKLDVASKAGLRWVLGRILSNLKAAARKPVIVPSRGGQPDADGLSDSQCISRDVDAHVESAVQTVQSLGASAVVPIVLTSAVQGTGINVLHALLRKLPAPRVPDSLPAVAKISAPLMTPLVLFHVEEIFALPPEFRTRFPGGASHDRSGAVVSGHLRHGEVATGDEVLLGPFPVDDADEGPVGPVQHQVMPRSVMGGRSVPDGPVLVPAKTGPPTASQAEKSDHRHTQDDPRSPGPEWRRMHVVSVRNLRLPTSKLACGQVGTIGFVELPGKVHSASDPSRIYKTADPASSEDLPNGLRIRKGMILGRNLDVLGRSCSGLVAVFDRAKQVHMAEGSLVVAYVGSVRSVARVTEVQPINAAVNENSLTGVVGDARAQQQQQRVSFRFTASREWVEVGCRLLVMPSGAPVASRALSRGQEDDVHLLEGSVGRVLQTLQ